MAIEVGKKYYFMVHVYHHFIAEVTAILGKKEVRVKNVVRVQGCKRGWTEFWKDGLKDDSTITHFPDGIEISGWFLVAPWHHEIPKPK